MSLNKLKFVRQPKGSTHCFWSVKSTGSEISDARIGRQYAMSYLEYEESNKGGSLLPLIIRDMCGTEQCIIKQHFLLTLARALDMALQYPDFIDELQDSIIC